MKKLYVGNLPFNSNEDQLRDWFSQAGFTAGSVTFIKDRMTGQPRGFGFVEMPNDEEADRAIAALNGQNFMGRKLVINEARPPQGGGGGGRDRGHGGGGGGRGRDRGDRGGYGGGFDPGPREPRW